MKSQKQPVLPDVPGLIWEARRAGTYCPRASVLSPTLGLGRVSIANGHLPAGHTNAQRPSWQQNPLNVLEGGKKTEQNKPHTQAKYLMN